MFQKVNETMDNFYWESIGYFLLVSITVYYQQLHGKNFKGNSQGFRLVLSVFALAGMIVEFAYLGYYAWNVSWWAAIIVFIFAALVVGLIGAILEKLVGGFILSVAGFFVLPVFGYLMFKSLPA